MRGARITFMVLLLAGLGAAALVLFLLFPQIVPQPSATDNRPTKAIVPRGDRPKFVNGFVLDKHSGSMWTPNLEWALAKAKKEKKQVFIAFDGITSTISRSNQVAVLGKQPVKDALLQFVLVSIYLDAIPQEYYQEAATDEQLEADSKANQDFQLDLFDVVTVPAYAILDPVDATHFRVGGTWYTGRILDVEAFSRFVMDQKASNK